MPDISITRGAGDAWITPGDFDVSLTARGYTGATITPTSCTVPSIGTEAFDIRMSGVATITVNDNRSNPLTGVNFMRSYGGSTTEADLYAPMTGAVVDNTDGTYTIKYLPYDVGSSTGNEYYVYFYLTKSGYTPISIQIEMKSASVTVATPFEMVYTPNEIVSLGEDMYNNFPIASGTLTLTAK